MPIPKPQATIFFCCDLQTGFRAGIYGYDHVVGTANKMVKLAKLLGIEVVATTQNARVFGGVDPGVDLDSLGPLRLPIIDKTLFSMVTDEVKTILEDRPHIKNVVIFGIEGQICVLQTALSLLDLPRKYIPYVVADGVSSSATFELPILFDRLQQEGAIVATSESLSFQLVGTSSNPLFKPFSQLVKGTKHTSIKAGEALIPRG